MYYDDSPIGGAFPYCRSSLEAVVETLISNPKVRSATKYESPTLVVTATRRGKERANSKHIEMVLTIGKPNFRGRAFIKACQKAGEPFPVRKVQLRWIPAKNKKRAD